MGEQAIVPLSVQDLARLVRDGDQQAGSLRRQLSTQPECFWPLFERLWQQSNRQPWPLGTGASRSLYDLCIRGQLSHTHPALVIANADGQEVSLSFADMDRWCAILAGAWQKVGVIQGARVLLAAKDPLQQILGWLTGWRCGAVPVLGHRWAPALIPFFADASQATHVFGARLATPAKSPVIELPWLNRFDDLQVSRVPPAGLYGMQDIALSCDREMQACPATFVDWPLQATAARLLRDATLFWPMRAGQAALVAIEQTPTFAQIWPMLCVWLNGGSVSVVDVASIKITNFAAATRRFEWVLALPTLARLLLGAPTQYGDKWQKWSLPASDARMVPLWSELHRRVGGKGRMVAIRELGIDHGGVGHWSVPTPWVQAEAAWQALWPPLGEMPKPDAAYDAAAATPIVVADVSGALTVARDTSDDEIAWRRTQTWLETWLTQSLGTPCYVRPIAGQPSAKVYELWILGTPTRKNPRGEVGQPVQAGDVATLIARELAPEFAPVRIFCLPVVARFLENGELDRSWCESQIWCGLWPNKPSTEVGRILTGLRERAAQPGQWELPREIGKTS